MPLPRSRPVPSVGRARRPGRAPCFRYKSMKPDGKRSKADALLAEGRPELVGLDLERLVESGLYGKNPAEAAERLVALGIEDLIRRDLLPRRPSVRPRKT